MVWACCSVEEYRAEGQPEQELFGGGATREVWDRCSVAALFGAGTDVPPVLARLEALLGLRQPLLFEAGGAPFTFRAALQWPQGPAPKKLASSLLDMQARKKQWRAAGLQGSISVSILAPGGGGARPGVDGQRARQLPADAGHRRPVGRPQARASLPFTTMQHSTPVQEQRLPCRGVHQPALALVWDDGATLGSAVSRWCEPPDAAAVNIILEPGLAFGTGEHPTTRLCLRALAGMPLRGARVVDYGTGALTPETLDPRKIQETLKLP